MLLYVPLCRRHRDVMLWLIFSGAKWKLNSNLLTVAKWLNDHHQKLTLDLEKNKCMLIGNDRKLESKVALTKSIFNHNVNNVNSFKCLGIFISSDFAWKNHVEQGIAGKIDQTRIGLLNRIKHLLHFSASLLFL